MRFLLISLLLISIVGCGSGAPDLSAVKKTMSPEQLALGDPIANSVDMALVPIPAGEFQMGTAAPKEPDWEQIKRRIKEAVDAGEMSREEAGAKYKELREQSLGSAQTRNGSSSRPHQVKITKPFFLSICEVTQQQYEAVMGTRPWRGKPLVEEGPDYAASYIEWDRATEFCRKLSERENATYRLPTEAEWEYACRAGTTTAWCFGDDEQQLTDYAWYDANAYHADEQYVHRIGRKTPNSWGLYDMHGNVWEWCHDWYAPYDGRKKEQVDPVGPKKGTYHVWRGGSFATAMDNTRSDTRLDNGRENYHPEYLAGFRVVREFE